MGDFLRGLPKAELHVHIEGTLEPELVFEMADRNGVSLPYAGVEELRAAFDFDSLQSFLDVYYAAAAVLQTSQDFYDMTMAYLQRAAADGVRRAEIFFDPQTHTERDVPMGAVIEGISGALADGGGQLGVDAALIMCFLRHLGAEAAQATFDEALAYRDHFIGIGLDSTEVGFPPSMFKAIFDGARAEGFHLVAHAGEEGPPQYVEEALDVLGVERIDHGVQAVHDPVLCRRIAAERIPLTTCPLSNVRLAVVDTLEQHPLPDLLHAGVMVTINSDDPSYFGGYIGDNYSAVYEALALPLDTMVELASNSIQASFLSPPDKESLMDELRAYVAANTPDP